MPSRCAPPAAPSAQPDRDPAPRGVSALRICLRRHFDDAVWLFFVAPDGEEPTLDFLEHSCVVVDHPAAEAYFNRSVGHQQLVALVAVEVLHEALLVLFVPAEAAFARSHGPLTSCPTSIQPPEASRANVCPGTGKRQRSSGFPAPAGWAADRVPLCFPTSTGDPQLFRGISNE